MAKLADEEKQGTQILSGELVVDIAKQASVETDPLSRSTKIAVDEVIVAIPSLVFERSIKRQVDLGAMLGIQNRTSLVRVSRMVSGKRVR